jgi:hypothetical protein
MSLREFLFSILTGGIALGPMVFALFEYLHLAQNMDSAKKRLLVAFVSAVIGIAAWSLAIFLGYEDFPLTRSAAAEAIWQHGIVAGLSAFASSSVIHGFFTAKPHGTPLLPLLPLAENTAELVVGRCINCPENKCNDCPIGGVRG